MSTFLEKSGKISTSMVFTVGVINAIMNAIRLKNSLVYHFVSGLTLGLCPPAIRKEITQKYYETNLSYTNPSFLDKGLFGWEEYAISKYLPSHGSILVLGAGGGREVRSLLGMGYNVYASDPVKTYIDSLKESFRDKKNLKDVFHTPSSELPKINIKFDAIIFGWAMYIHIPTREKRVALLRAARQALKKEGGILLSYWKPTQTFGRGKVLSYQVARFFANCFHAPLPEMGESVEFRPEGAFFARHFSEEDLKKEFVEAGLSIVWQGREGCAVLKKK